MLSGIINCTFRRDKILHFIMITFILLVFNHSCLSIQNHFFEEAYVHDMLLIDVFYVGSLPPVMDPSDLILTRGTLDEEDEEADSDTEDIDHRGERWLRWLMRTEQLLILSLFARELSATEGRP